MVKARNFLILFCFLANLSVFCMQTTNMHINLFPQDVLKSIVQFSFPKMNLYYNKADDRNDDQHNKNNAVKNLQILIDTIITLGTINKLFNNITANNITAWLDINKDNINAFLIRSTQANIPYFIKIALKNNANNLIPFLKAHPDFVHEPDGCTPLIYATEANHYSTCKFLLEKGASVNIRKQCPTAFGYNYNPDIWPIHIAISNNNLELVKLFIQHGANLDFSKFLCTPLLSFAAEKNNPYILSTLLDARPHTDYNNHWSGDDIEHALETVKYLQVRTNKEKLEKRACINILEQAHENTAQSNIGSFFTPTNECTQQ